MTLQHRITILVTSLLVALGVTFGAAWIGYQTARADDYTIQVSDGGAGPELASAPSPAPAAAPSSTPPSPQFSDVDVATKLYKGGSYFGLGILVLYLALFVGFKIDKKRAFYYATGLSGLAVVVDSIRRGDTPNAVTLASVLGPTIGIMITGPGHERAPAPAAPATGN